MESCIIKTDEIYSIYTQGYTLRLRKYQDNKWSDAQTIAKDIHKGFSIIHCQKGEPVILYRDNDGNIMLAEGTKPHRMVLRNTGENITPLNIEGIIKDNVIQIFYNREYIKENYLTEQHRYADGSWSRPVILDKYTANPNMTKIVAVEDNYILFYSKKVPEQQIGYREISNYSTSDYKMLYATGYKILDYSLAVTADEIHIAIVIATSRNNKLIYLNKTQSGVSKAKTLYEGLIKGCHIAIENSKITITFASLKNNCRITSYDMGNTFNRVESIENFTFNKTTLADYSRQSADRFSACELITDINYPYNVKYCPYFNNDNESEIERLKKEIDRLKGCNKGNKMLWFRKQMI